MMRVRHKGRCGVELGSQSKQSSSQTQPRSLNHSSLLASTAHRILSPTTSTPLVVLTIQHAPNKPPRTR